MVMNDKFKGKREAPGFLKKKEKATHTMRRICEFGIGGMQSVHNKEYSYDPISV